MGDLISRYHQGEIREKNMEKTSHIYNRKKKVESKRLTLEAIHTFVVLAIDTD